MTMEPLHTEECLAYAAKTRKAYCIDACAASRRARLRLHETAEFEVAWAEQVKLGYPCAAPSEVDPHVLYGSEGPAIEAVRMGWRMRVAYEAPDRTGMTSLLRLRAALLQLRNIAEAIYMASPKDDLGGMLNAVEQANQALLKTEPADPFEDTSVGTSSPSPQLRADGPGARKLEP